MNKNFVFFPILISILIGGSFGLFSIEDSFAEQGNQFTLSLKDELSTGDI